MTESEIKEALSRVCAAYVSGWLNDGEYQLLRDRYVTMRRQLPQNRSANLWYAVARALTR